jgi:hypothetical protein
MSDNDYEFRSFHPEEVESNEDVLNIVIDFFVEDCGDYSMGHRMYEMNKKDGIVRLVESSLKATEKKEKEMFECAKYMFSVYGEQTLLV